MAIVSQTAKNYNMVIGPVVSAMRTQGPQVAKRIVEIVYDGNPPADLTVEQFMLDLADYLEGSAERFSQLASLVIAETGEDLEASASENAAVEEHREEIFWQRGQIEGTYGAATAARLGYSGMTPRDAHGIVQASINLEDNLRKHGFPATTRPRRSRLDPINYADTLEMLRIEVEQSARDNQSETRETQQARSERDATEEDLRYDYRGVAGIAVGMFYLGREDAMAERVRPTARRNKGLPEPEDLEDADKAEADVDAPVEA